METIQCLPQSVAGKLGYGVNRKAPAMLLLVVVVVRDLKCPDAAGGLGTCTEFAGQIEVTICFLTNRNCVKAVPSHRGQTSPLLSLHGTLSRNML